MVDSEVALECVEWITEGEKYNFYRHAFEHVYNISVCFLFFKIPIKNENFFHPFYIHYKKNKTKKLYHCFVLFYTL